MNKLEKILAITQVMPLLCPKFVVIIAYAILNLHHKLLQLCVVIHLYNILTFSDNAQCSLLLTHLLTYSLTAGNNHVSLVVSSVPGIIFNDN